MSVTGTSYRVAVVYYLLPCGVIVTAAITEPVIVGVVKTFDSGSEAVYEASEDISGGGRAL